ncbi:MAG TPA: serine/threonine-protein kinase [Thermoanaerobaculia bacterium]|nr:serine/threonine-protein kinase [Thermoanaerobaculia bacterium]
MIPTRLGRYEILDELGKGAAGVVYLARDPLIGRLVALKTFRVGYSVKDQELQQFRARFIREAQSAGILSHPNIVTIHDVVEEGNDGVAFIAMEYVRGTNLKQILQGGTPLGLPFAAEIVRQVGEALDYAHSRGVVHRDVKPANIIITADNRVKITDFGIARLDTSNLTQEGQLLGTPNYMAPEQILGKEVDHRADLFSLGVVLYEMLTRHKPFQGENLTAVSHRIVYDHFTPPRQYVRDLPPELERILGRALAKEPAQRYQRARELMDDIKRLVGERPAAEVESLNDTQSLGATEVLAERTPVEPAAVVPIWRRLLARRRPAAGPPAAAAVQGGSAAPALQALALDDDTVSSGLDLADVVPLVPPDPWSAPPAPPPGRAAPPAARRLVLLATGAAMVPVLAIAAALLVVAWTEPPAPAAVKDVHRQVVPLLTRGEQLRRSGFAPQAAALFGRAERLAPEVTKLGQLRRAAERERMDLERRQALEQEIAARLGEAQAALAVRGWDDAEAAGRRLLELDPKHPAAPQLLAAATIGRAREGEAQRMRLARNASAAADTRPSPAETPVAPPLVAVAPAPPPLPVDSTLQVEFHSDLPRGTFSIRDRKTVLFQERFDFREGRIWNRRPAGGSLHRTLDLVPGTDRLRVYVTPDGRPAEVAEVAGGFAGGSRRLVVQLTAAGRIHAQLY